MNNPLFSFETFIIINISGRLDISNSVNFESRLIKLIDDDCHDFIINFSNLEYISSGGLRVLLVAAKKLAGYNKKLILCGLKPHIKEVLEIAGFLALFTVIDTLQDFF